MARTNKYTSVNFNEIYEKKHSNTKNNPLAKPNNSSSLVNNGGSKTMISNSRIQGNMLVLTRPSPKPVSIPPPPLDLKENQNQETGRTGAGTGTGSGPDLASLSLRPQGRTGTGIGTGPGLFQPGLVSPVGASLKTNKFVPPHLRPGFVGKEEKPIGPGLRGVVNREIGSVGQRQGVYGSSQNRYGENGRPKSGGGYDGRGRGGGYGGGDVDPVYFMNRPGSAQL